MANKKKKKKEKKHNKLTHPQFNQLNSNQLFVQGEQFLENNNPRNALTCFKLALTKGKTADQVNIYIFRSYLLRESQLRKKGMIQEAESIKKQVNKYFPKLDQFSDNDIKLYVSASSNKEAVSIYNKYIATHKISPETEKILANRVFSGQALDFIKNIDDVSPLKRDVDTASQGIKLMNDGLWEDALESLRSIPRSSPFAHIRLFCRAMVSFYSENDADMFKALSLIPDDFPLISVVKGLKSLADTDSKHNTKKESTPLPQCLWDSPVNQGKSIVDFIQKFFLGNLNQTARLACSIADTLYPEDPHIVRMLLIQFVWKTSIKDNARYNDDYDDRFDDLVEKILTSDEEGRFYCKTNLIDSETPWIDAYEYIAILKAEFPDAQDLEIAHSMVLIYAVNKIYHENIYFPPNIAPAKKYIKGYTHLLGIEPDNLNNREMILIDMAVKAVQLDPCNVKGYEILVQLPHTSRIAKKKVEEALAFVIKALPDDSTPCLELATLLYEKNAFRKAENALQKAIQRSPHDNKVIEQHALSFLISAGINLNKGNGHLVEKDLQKAASVNCSKIAPFLAAKKILFNVFAEQKKISETIFSELKGRTFYERLRILSIILLDLKNYQLKNSSNKLLKNVTKIFNKELGQSQNLLSSDIVKLMAPLDKTYLAILPSVKIADIFTKKWKCFSKYINNDDLGIIFNFIFDEDNFNIITKEIHKRSPQFSPSQDIIMDFYLAVIKYINGDNVDATLFKTIIDNADTSTLKELQIVSRGLAPHTSGPLQSALSVFDFDVLDSSGFGEIVDNDFFYDDDDDEFANNFFPNNWNLHDLDFDNFDMNEEEMVITVGKMFLENMGLMGAPDSVIKELRAMLRSQPGDRKQLDSIADKLKKMKKKNIPREVELFFVGKVTKK